MIWQFMFLICLGVNPFKVPWVPTGIKTGVSTGPWGNVRIDTLALVVEQVAIVLNVKALFIASLYEEEGTENFFATRKKRGRVHSSAHCQFDPIWLESDTNPETGTEHLSSVCYMICARICPWLYIIWACWIQSIGLKKSYRSSRDVWISGNIWWFVTKIGMIYSSETFNWRTPSSAWSFYLQIVTWV